jgi:hypothetical protein
MDGKSDCQEESSRRVYSLHGDLATKFLVDEGITPSEPAVWTIELHSSLQTHPSASLIGTVEIFR